ncbi:MAG: PEP-CTERM sorting domain-containing protein [Phycisphaerae bacterium]|nr:PEP-CTERM sorting domain-containing protein [Phycisphaerae bacterium]NIP52557.1 PEP-CTERM sorting domain-containing protein [Phycisphaerae bacterium]NIS51541.1 PEP-CTERM sorting domain-containing protein [Phycisphaerae bacterium]NIU09123.1 PEP-CTERM sorting domain-containing protein [Phycisphaerae bacterium]NIU59623.1 PEP-CTERM sorting domain-containing protein [Phycisphaerae bacterium]
MLKKAEILLSLMLVVSMASAANAMMNLELRRGAGNTVDVYATSGYVVGDDIYFAVVGDTSEVAVSGGSVSVLAPEDTVIYGNDARASGICPPSMDGMWGFIGDVDGVPSTGIGTYIGGINWSMVGGATEAEIFLFGGPFEFYLLDTITVPEPTTFLFLALGSLLLTRRRR